MFHLLNIPELETEASGKLTMHQVLRVLYSDQLSAVEKIFRDDNFDSPALREAVGRLLFGAYEGDIYANQLRIREFEKELATIEASLRSIYTLLAGVEHNLTLDWVAAERRKIEHEMQKLDAEIVEAEASHYSDAANEEVSLDPLNRAFSEAQRAQIEMTKVEDAETALQLEHADSEIFIITLERKIRALQDSSSVASAISEIQYAWCPSCFAPLAADNNPSACRLCKEPFDEGRLRRRIVNQLNDMVIQLKQSRALQAARSQDVVALARRKAELREQWEAARRELSKVRRAPTSDARDRLRALNERSGYLKRELEGVSEKAALIERLDRMSRQKVELTAAIAGLVDANDLLKATEAERLSKAYTEVAQQTVYFLHHDLPRQDSFQNAQTVNFSFSKDTISVDGQSYFSASSTVYLKNAFLTAFLIAASRNAQFRHLRFLVLDTIEDKGMEPERSQNFQKLLVERSSELDHRHQIIFATAMISPDLDNDEYVVGRRSTHKNRTLALVG